MRRVAWARTSISPANPQSERATCSTPAALSVTRRRTFTILGAPTRLRIGDDNTFREYVTVHRSNRLDEKTVIGSHNLFMAHCHVGHDCELGDGIVLANGAQLAGYVIVGDRAFISAYCLVHQFVRVGTLALMQGRSGISKDLPPFTVARGNNGICGLNVVGLRRAGVPPEARLELRRIYRSLFRSRIRIHDAVTSSRGLAQSSWGRLLIDFVATSTRGVCLERCQRLDPEGP